MDIERLIGHIKSIDCEECGTNLVVIVGRDATLDLGLLAGVAVDVDFNKIIFINCPECGHITQILLEYVDEDD